MKIIEHFSSISLNYNFGSGSGIRVPLLLKLFCLQKVIMDETEIANLRSKSVKCMALFCIFAFIWIFFSFISPPEGYEVCYLSTFSS